MLALLACLIGLAWVGTTVAAEREYWRHSNGHFENTEGNKWREKSPGGTFNFVEQQRTLKFVQLYDRSRDVTIRLFDDRCMIRKGDNPFELKYEGKWGK